MAEKAKMGANVSKKTRRPERISRLGKINGEIRTSGPNRTNWTDLSQFIVQISRTSENIEANSEANGPSRTCLTHTVNKVNRINGQQGHSVTMFSETNVVIMTCWIKYFYKSSRTSE